MHNTQPQPQYSVSDEAFLNNPYAELFNNSTRTKDKDHYKVRMRLFEGVKHIFQMQGYVTRNNYHALASQYQMRWSTVIKLYNDHIKNKYLERKF